jgi:hypothetical protein
MPGVSADCRSDLQGQGPSANGPVPRGRGEANTSHALPNGNKFAGNQDQQVGHGRVGNALRRHPLVSYSIQTAPNKAALRSLFELKDQAGVARQGPARRLPHARPGTGPPVPKFVEFVQTYFSMGEHER